MGINPQAYNYSLCIRLLLIVALFLVLISCEKEYDFSKVEAFMQNTTLGDEIIPGRDPTSVFVAKHTHNGIAPEKQYLPPESSCKNHFREIPDYYDFHILGVAWTAVGSPDVYRLYASFPVDFSENYIDSVFGGNKTAAIELYHQIALETEVKKIGREADESGAMSDNLIQNYFWYIDERYTYRVALSSSNGMVTYLIDKRP